ncbi:MAG TPA: hypothetical protein VFX28_15280, partial [Methylomirabilota bacterium]|nr:hypothetical protein [Methylomirabilota bacterium]
SPERRASVCLLAMDARRPDPTLAVDLAYLGGAIERWAGDLAMTEEPARFLVALESMGPALEPPPATDAGGPEPSR